MKTVYLHIGTPKTGTKALQSFLRKNEGILESKGYSYPYLDLGINNIFNKRNAQFLVHASKNISPIESKRVRREGFAALKTYVDKYDNIILSEETIWARSQRGKCFWKDVVEDFKRIQCQVKVVVYLRRQDLLVQSLWNQSIKAYTRSTKTFEEYMDTEEYKYIPLDYYSYLNKIAQHVGKDNVIVRVYEKEQYFGCDKNIFSDFLHVIGLEMTEEYSAENLASNIGLSSNYVEMKRILNKIPEYEEMADFLARPMVLANLHQSKNELHAKQSMFSYEEQVAFIAKYNESNMLVAKEYLNREDGILFKEDIKKIEQWKLDVAKIYEDMIVLMVEALCAEEKKVSAHDDVLLKMDARVQQLERSSGGMRLRSIRQKIKSFFRTVC